MSWENVSFGSRLIPRFFGCFVVGSVYLIYVIELCHIKLVWCKMCGCSFVSVCMKIAGAGSFMYFVKVWLNECWAL